MVNNSSLRAIEILDEGCESSVVLAHHERNCDLVASFVEHFRETFADE
jgi:hypothetical protein